MIHTHPFLIPEIFGNLILYIVRVSWKCWKYVVHQFSRILEVRAAGRRLLWSVFSSLDYFWKIVPGISGHAGNIGNTMFVYVCDFYKKGTRQNFTQHRPMAQRQKLKLFKVLIPE